VLILCDDPRVIFGHGVASGDPLSDRVVIWTRVTTDEQSVAVGWVLARDVALEDVVASGETHAHADCDHTVHVDVSGLEPATSYHYAFTAGDETSAAGRTRTLPAGDVERVRFAMCSCAKFNAGFFNAYARISEHDGLDFLLHLGDYIYEEADTPPKGQTPGADIERPFDPLHECQTLEDYRRRYAQHRSDPDVQRLHCALAVIATLDDHELADGAWKGGCSEDRSAEHGPWKARREAALQARWEWLPSRPPDPDDPTRVFRTIGLGELAAVQLLDIRSRRDKPVPPPAMNDPDRSMLGAQQRDWLFGALDGESGAWQIIATPSIFTRTWSAQPKEPLRTALLELKLMDADGDGPDYDQWDGYPAERAAHVARLAQLNDVVLLSGDIHASVAAQVRDEDGATVAVEMTTTSLTSQNLDDKLAVANRDPVVTSSEDAFIAAHDHVSWCEFASHGYVVVDVDAHRLRGEWWYVDTVLKRTDVVRRAAAFEVPRGQPTLNAAR
jgi:alkaline phosphatase D